MTYYSDEQTVRLRFGFHSEEARKDIKGTNFDLKDRAYSILQLEKNGVRLYAPTDYSLAKPHTIVLTTAAIQTDRFFIVFGTKIPPEMVKEAMEHAVEDIVSFLSDVYTPTRVDEWKQTTLNHGTVVGGPFQVDEIITGQRSEADAKVISVGTTSIVLQLLTTLGFQAEEQIDGATSSAQAIIDKYDGVLLEAPGLIQHISQGLSGCYMWDILWDKNHTVSSEIMEQIYKKMEYYFKKLAMIQIGKINLPGETRTGSRSKPAIGRATRQVFRKQLDLEDTDWTLFPRVNPGDHFS